METDDNDPKKSNPPTEVGPSELVLPPSNAAETETNTRDPTAAIDAPSEVTKALESSSQEGESNMKPTDSTVVPGTPVEKVAPQDTPVQAPVDSAEQPEPPIETQTEKTVPSEAAKLPKDPVQKQCEEVVATKPPVQTLTEKAGPSEALVQPPADLVQLPEQSVKTKPEKTVSHEAPVDGPSETAKLPEEAMVPEAPAQALSETVKEPEVPTQAPAADKTPEPERKPEETTMNKVVPLATDALPHEVSETEPAVDQTGQNAGEEPEEQEAAEEADASGDEELEDEEYYYDNEDDTDDEEEEECKEEEEEEEEDEEEEEKDKVEELPERAPSPRRLRSTRLPPQPKCTFCQKVQGPQDESLTECTACHANYHLRVCLRYKPEFIISIQKISDWKCPRCIHCANCKKFIDDPWNVECTGCTKAWHGACAPKGQYIGEFHVSAWFCQKCVRTNKIEKIVPEPYNGPSADDLIVEALGAQMAELLKETEKPGDEKKNKKPYEFDEIDDLVEELKQRDDLFEKLSYDNGLTKDVPLAVQLENALRKNGQSSAAAKDDEEEDEDEDEEEEECEDEEEEVVGEIDFSEPHEELVDLHEKGKEQEAKRRKYCGISSTCQQSCSSQPPYFELMFPDWPPIRTKHTPEEIRLFKIRHEAEQRRAEITMKKVALKKDIARYKKAKEQAYGKEPMKTCENGQRIVFVGVEYNATVMYKSDYDEPMNYAAFLFICRYCLYTTHHESDQMVHFHQCKVWTPPGKQIYFKDNMSFYEVDGKKEPKYCTSLCLLAKCFIQSKQVHDNLKTFKFYVLCEFNNEEGHQPVGYFSKEKNPANNNNLSCITVFPQFSRKGYGSMLIDMSYELSRIERRVGHPEHPISNAGIIGYRSFWRSSIICYLRQHKNCTRISIKDMALTTRITEVDIINQLMVDNMIVLKNGLYSIKIGRRGLKHPLSTFRRRAIVAELIKWKPDEDVRKLDPKKLNKYC